MRWLPIGQTAKETGISVPTIRLYERKGLFEKSLRAANGFRLFDSAAIARLQLIKQLKDRGFTLAEIRASFAANRDQSPDSDFPVAEANGGMTPHYDRERRIHEFSE